MFPSPLRGRLSAGLLLCTAVVWGAEGSPIARVGSSTVSAEALTRRLAKMPEFQRVALADSPDALKRRVLETELIPELLAAEEAARVKLGDRPALRARVRELLRDALEHDLRREVETQAALSKDELRAYFEANRTRFETPRRVHIWRILLDDEALAKKIISESKAVDGMQRWSQFARESSLDKATHLRNGDLGFVHPDGNTDTPTVRVDPILFVAADKLADGELSPEPLKEGQHFAVIWRRGSMKAVSRSLAQEEASIRQVLLRQRLELSRNALLARLTQQFLTEKHEALLETFQFKESAPPTLTSTARPAHAPPAGSSPPSPSERGER